MFCVPLETVIYICTANVNFSNAKPQKNRPHPVSLRRYRTLHDYKNVRVCV